MHTLTDQSFNCTSADSCLSPAYQQEHFLCHGACIVAFDTSRCVIVWSSLLQGVCLQALSCIKMCLALRNSSRWYMPLKSGSSRSACLHTFLHPLKARMLHDHAEVFPCQSAASFSCKAMISLCLQLAHLNHIFSITHNFYTHESYSQEVIQLNQRAAAVLC